MPCGREEGRPQSLAATADLSVDQMCVCETYCMASEIYKC